MHYSRTPSILHRATFAWWEFDSTVCCGVCRRRSNEAYISFLLTLRCRQEAKSLTAATGKLAFSEFARAVPLSRKNFGLFLNQSPINDSWNFHLLSRRLDYLF